MSEEEDYVLRSEALLLNSQSSYINDELYIEGVRVRDIVSAYGTPVYIYSSSVIEGNSKRFTDCLKGLGVKVCYAMKANDRLGILKEIKRSGLGIDVVSGGEIYRALSVGVSPSDIIFSGVGKSERDIDYAASVGIERVNVESDEEIKVWSFYARKYGHEINVSFRLNPDVSAGGHDKIRTGRSGDKFGLDGERVVDLWKCASELESLRVNGLAVHIGSQIFAPSFYKIAGRKLLEVAENIRSRGYQVRNFDLGGGFGVRYKDEEEFDFQGLRTVIEEFKSSCGEHDNLYIEPGRAIVAEAGMLVGRVNAIKHGGELIIVDIGMHNMIRPSLYGSYHHVLPLERGSSLVLSNLVGPICESGDKIVSSVWLPRVEYGDYLAVMTTGAYGTVLASHYNARGKAAEILVDKKNIKEIVKAETPYYIGSRENNDKTIE